MAATAKSHGNLPYVDLRQAASSNYIYSILHAGQGKNHVQILHIPQFVYQEGKIPYIGITREPADSHVNTIYRVVGNPLNHFA